MLRDALQQSGAVQSSFNALIGRLSHLCQAFAIVRVSIEPEDVAHLKASTSQKPPK